MTRSVDHSPFNRADDNGRRLVHVHQDDTTVRDTPQLSEAGTVSLRHRQRIANLGHGVIVRDLERYSVDLQVDAHTVLSLHLLGPDALYIERRPVGQDGIQTRVERQSDNPSDSPAAADVPPSVGGSREGVAR